MLVDPASRAFSKSSLTAFAGRWMICNQLGFGGKWTRTSAAAMRLTTSAVSFLMGLGACGAGDSAEDVSAPMQDDTRQSGWIVDNNKVSSMATRHAISRTSIYPPVTQLLLVLFAPTHHTPTRPPSNSTMPDRSRRVQHDELGLRIPKVKHSMRKGPYLVSLVLLLAATALTLLNIKVCRMPATRR